MNPVLQEPPAVSQWAFSTIHLKEVSLYGGGGQQFPFRVKTHSLLIWRGQLKDVSGFFLGGVEAYW